jgi:hypothetical protein
MTISITTDHGRRRRKWPPCAPHEALHPASSSSLDGGRLPEQVHKFFQRLRGCMTLKTFQCCGDASSPEQKSALRAIHPLTPPKIIIACSGFFQPSVRCIVAGLDASFWALGGHVSAGVCHGCDGGCVCFVVCRSTNHLFTFKPWHIGYCWKAIILSRTILALY